jgi:pimeloyl-ACP methyl ester carboxylesterase
MKKNKLLKRLSPARIVGQLLNWAAIPAPRIAARIAMNLFCTPRNKKLKPAERAFLATADWHEEWVGGQRFAVYHWGFRGPIVLLAHGWESHSGRWRKIAPMLAQAGYQVVAVDAPAHGRSAGRQFTMVHYAEVLRALFQRLGPIDTVIGHSVGGAAMVWAMGTAAPALRPRKAVIMGSFSEVRTIMDAARTEMAASERLMAEMDNEFVRRIGAPVSHFSIATAASQLHAVSSLLIHDRQDRVTHFGESEKLYQAWPGAQLFATEGFGHGLTAPQVTEAVVDFVREPILA